jgi:hypothetical protein
MSTRRTPISRTPSPRISPAAIRLFDHMRRCSDGERWWRLHSDLVDELGTKPWQWPCIQAPNTQSSYIGWKPNLEAQERWKMLAKASREAKREEREARRARAATAPTAPPEPAPTP